MLRSYDAMKFTEFGIQCSLKARIDFDELKVSLTCPHDMDFDGSVLRVVRFSFDHWSGYAPSTTITFEDAEYIRRSMLPEIHLVLM